MTDELYPHGSDTATTEELTQPDSVKEIHIER
jgi:hypothetical protein